MESVCNTIHHLPDYTVKCFQGIFPHCQPMTDWLLFIYSQRLVCLFDIKFKVYKVSRSWVDNEEKITWKRSPYMHCIVLCYKLIPIMPNNVYVLVCKSKWWGWAWLLFSIPSSFLWIPYVRPLRCLIPELCHQVSAKFQLDILTSEKLKWWAQVFHKKMCHTDR